MDLLGQLEQRDGVFLFVPLQKLAQCLLLLDLCRIHQSDSGYGFVVILLSPLVKLELFYEKFCLSVSVSLASEYIAAHFDYRKYKADSLTS